MGFSLRDYIIHGIYFTLYGVVKYLPSPIGDVLRYTISKPFVGKMGKVRMYEGTTLWYPYRIKLGSNVTLNEWVYISGYGNVTIGDAVRIGSRATILSSDHEFRDCSRKIYQQGIQSGGVVIEDDVFIGTGAIILKGVTVGTHSVIGAGSVVVKDVPPYSVVAGNPARVITALSEDLKSPAALERAGQTEAEQENVCVGSGALPV